MNISMFKQLFSVLLVLFLLNNTSSAQIAGTNNTLSSTGITAIQSGTAAGYKLSIGGATKIFGTGNAGVVGSPTLLIGNNTASTGRKYGLHSSNAGQFQIYDSTGATPTIRFNIAPTTGNIGIGRLATAAANKLEIDNTTPNTSGLRFTRLTSASTVIALNGKKLSVNTTGDVILTADSLSISQSPNRILAGPASGSTAVIPTFRSLVALDIPNLDMAKIVTGNLPLTRIGNVTPARLLGRFNAATGTVQEISLGSGLTLNTSGVLSAAGGANYWTETGNNISNNNTGNVGIGTSTPNFKLDVLSNTGQTAMFKNGDINNASFTQVDIFRPNAGLYSGQGMSVIALGSTYPASGALKADGGFFGANAGASGGLSIASSHPNGQIRFYTGGADDINQRLTINSVGNTVFKSELGNADDVAFAINSGTTSVNTYVNLFEQRKSGSMYFRTQWGGNILYYDANGGLYTGSGIDVNFTQSGSVYGNYFRASKLKGLNWDQTEVGIDAPSITYKSTGASYIAANTSAHKFTVSYPLTEANTNIASFDNGGTPLVTISKDGKLLIGTTAGAAGVHSLAVNGSAIFTKAVVKLNGNWPDYVFEPNYGLLPIAQLEKYIQQNRHLPNIPSAAEVKKEGIDLGNSQTLQLQKIEELTLYIIDLNKKIEALQKDNVEIKKQLNQKEQKK
jgi:hypothetical protein